MMDSSQDTRSDAYARYLERPRFATSLRQLPYRTHLRVLKLGATLDIGCGVGRNLATSPAGSVGVDHNDFSIDAARRAVRADVSRASYFRTLPIISRSPIRKQRSVFRI
jgi:SAM-dependent methyltransferase